MEASAHIKMFCRNIWVTGKARHLGNDTGTKRVGEIGDRIGDTSVHTKYFRYLDALMVRVNRAPMDEFIRDIMAHDLDTS